MNRSHRKSTVEKRCGCGGALKTPWSKRCDECNKIHEKERLNMRNYGHTQGIELVCGCGCGTKFWKANGQHKYVKGHRPKQVRLVPERVRLSARKHGDPAQGKRQSVDDRMDAIVRAASRQDYDEKHPERYL